MSTRWRYILMAVAFALALAAFTMLFVSEADCMGRCPSWRCYNSAGCGRDCVCLIAPGDNTGQCWGVGTTYFW